MEPRLPTLQTPDLRRKFYGESSTDDLIRIMLFACNVARQNNEDASDAARQQFYAKYEESVVVRIKSNLLLMIFWLHIY